MTKMTAKSLLFTLHAFYAAVSVSTVQCFAPRLGASKTTTLVSNNHYRSSRLAVSALSDAADSNITVAITPTHVQPSSASHHNDPPMAASSNSNASVAFPIETTPLPSSAASNFKASVAFPIESPQSSSSYAERKKWTRRLKNAIPRLRRQGDDLDREIMGTALPSMLNLAVVPIVNSVDTFWVGRMGVELALAGQAAANQAFFALYFLVSFLPTITAPLVAKAVGSGNTDAAQARVCESLFLCNVLGAVGTLYLVAMPRTALSLVLPADIPAMDYAAPYLRLRTLSMIPALLSATGFAAYRGMLNTVTPLKVSLITNVINLIMDPLLIFHTGYGFVGAALATAFAETTSGLIYLKLLLRRQLARWSMLFRPPSLTALVPLLQGSAAMLFRQMTLNVAFLAAGRRAQTMDPTGVSAAAYGIVMQMYSVGIVVHVAMQQTAAALVPNTLCQSGKEEARHVADRMFTWGSIVGAALGATQFLALPFLVPLFSTLPHIQEAVRTPALIASLIHLVNGPVFAGEGVMLGLSQYKDLAIITVMGVSTMVACLLTPLGQRLNGVLISMGAFCLFQAVGVVIHHLRFSPLANKSKTADVICDVE